MRVDVLWLTNVASPYRRPIWEWLGTYCGLTVGLVEPVQHTQRDGRRGSDWLSVEAGSYRIVPLRTARIAGGENARFALRSWSPLPKRVPDMVIGGWDQPAYWQALVRAKIAGRRVVGFYESTLHTHRFSGGLIGLFRKIFFRSLDAVVVPGVAARAAVERMGIAADRIFEGFNAVDVEFFHREVKAARARDSVVLNTVSFDFIYVGQFIARKNVMSLIEALASIEGATLLLVGGGDEADELKFAVGALGLNDRVVFHETVVNSDLPRLLARAETLVLPSHQEVWGLVVNEALAGGLCAVVARHAGVAESVASMRGVFLTDVDPESLSQTMRAARDARLAPIEAPEILSHTPQSFASVFAQALRLEVGGATVSTSIQEREMPTP